MNEVGITADMTDDDIARESLAFLDAEYGSPDVMRKNTARMRLMEAIKTLDLPRERIVSIDQHMRYFG